MNVRNRSAPSGVVSLPRWLTPKPKYSLDTVALVLAIVLREHGTGAAVKRSAKSLCRRALPEHLAMLRQIAELPDDRAVASALKLVQGVTELLNILPGQTFPVKLTPTDDNYVNQSE